MDVSNLGTNLIPNTSNLTPFDLAASADAGIFIDSRANALQICQELASSIGACLVTDLAGKFKLVRIVTDITTTPDYYVTSADMEEKSLEISEKLEVVGAVKLAYCKNWTVQENGLAFGLNTNSAALFNKEWFYVLSQDATALIKYQQTAEVPQKDTLLITEAASTAEANRLLAIKKTPRFIYTATYFSHMLLIELGETVNITYPRFGLNAGKTGMVVSVERDWLNGRATIGVLI